MAGVEPASIIASLLQSTRLVRLPVWFLTTSSGSTGFVPFSAGRVIPLLARASYPGFYLENRTSVWLSPDGVKSTPVGFRCLGSCKLAFDIAELCEDCVCFREGRCICVGICLFQSAFKRPADQPLRACKGSSMVSKPFTSPSLLPAELPPAKSSCDRPSRSARESVRSSTLRELDAGNCPTPVSCRGGCCTAALHHRCRR